MLRDYSRRFTSKAEAFYKTTFSLACGRIWRERKEALLKKRLSQI